MSTLFCMAATGRAFRPATGGDIRSPMLPSHRPAASSGGKYPGGERAPARDGGSAPSTAPIGAGEKA